MIPFFPTPYPDETIYSIFARYSVYTGNNYQNTIKELLGIKKRIGDGNRIGYIKSLHKNVKGLGLSDKDIIFNHTIFPLLAPFIDQYKRDEIMELMLDKGENKYIYANALRFNPYFQHCSICIREDVDKYGEPYWHRVHQMPGVIVCPKHNQLLMKTKEIIPYAHFILPDTKKLYTKLSDNEVSDNTFKLLNKYAVEVLWLLNNREFDGFNMFNDRIRKKMWNEGYYRTKKTVDRKKLSIDILKFYGNSTLKFFDLTIKRDNPGWIYYIGSEDFSIEKKILIIIFFWGSIKKFLNDKKISDVENKRGKKGTKLFPFGIGPWPCLNPICKHYRINVIQNYKLSTNKNGIFVCKCGFKYLRKEFTDKYDVTSKISLGPVLEKRIYELLMEGRSSVDICTELGISKNKIANYKSKINSGNTYNQIEKTQQFEKLKKIKEKNAILLTRKKKYRKQWLELNDRKEYTRLYHWLYFHDREWLKMNIYNKKKNVGCRVNWNERDEALLIELKKIVDNWNDLEQERLKRITLNSFRLLLRSILPNDLNKVPKSNEYINSVIETPEQFFIRRLESAISVFEKNDKTINVYSIMKLVNPTHKQYKFMKNFLDEYLNK